MKRMVPRFRWPLALFALILGLAATLVAAGRSDRTAAPGSTATPSTPVAIAPAPAPAAAPAAPAPAPARVTPRPSRIAPAPEAVAAVPAPAPAEAGMRVYLDPETGTIGGPIGGGTLAPESLDPMNDSAEGLVVEVLPNGSQMVNLQGRFQEYYVVQIDASGRRVVRCIRDPRALNALGAEPAPLPRYEER